MVTRHTSRITSEQTACAALSYILIGIIWYFVDKKMQRSAFTKHHAQQGLVVLILALAVHIVYIIPILGWIIGFIGQILVLILAIIGIIYALQNRMDDLPVVGEFGKKFKI